LQEEDIQVEDRSALVVKRMTSALKEAVSHIENLHATEVGSDTLTDSRRSKYNILEEGSQVRKEIEQAEEV
jgi:hypothetical protein